ncbi:MAG TPA: hypothetical protein P5048_00805 [Chlamydiales bacterium]|nr:hypothetical protein [Chlamydiales bacterium]
MENTLNKTKNLKELESVLSKAVKKVGASKENDLCKYLPMKSGGYMHHFTLKKMKKRNPSELTSLLTYYIINADRPLVVAPKSRAPRGSRQRNDQLAFTRTQLDRMLNLARLAGDSEIISILRPQKSLAYYKRELINAVRQEKVNQDLWNGYVEAVNATKSLSSNS